jgi:hypothetical protein
MGLDQLVRRIAGSMRRSDAATQRALELLDESGFDALSYPQKVLATVWALEAEVNNGGFDQFFFNSAGDLAFFAPEALRAIGANSMAGLAQKANGVFGPEGPPRDWDTRRRRVQAYGQETMDYLNELDSVFFDYPDKIGELLDAYVEKECML